MVESLNEVVRLDIYRQMRVCSEKYKPIFASFASGSAEVPRISDFMAEVMHLYEALQPYYEKNRELARFGYLRAVDEIAPYADDFSLVLQDIYHNVNGTRIDGRQAGGKQAIGERRALMLQKFLSARQALERLAYDLKLVAIDAEKGGMNV